MWQTLVQALLVAGVDSIRLFRLADTADSAHHDSATTSHAITKPCCY